MIIKLQLKKKLLRYFNNEPDCSDDFTNNS